VIYREKHSSGDGGILLFVNADRPHDAVSILDAGSELVGTVEQVVDTREWTHESVSEQAKLVDLLRGMQQDPYTRKLRKLALMISAWDVVEQTDKTPEEWLKEELPFLWQFLTSNSQSFHVQVFGISAQGGDLNDEARTSLLEKVPSERIKVKVGGYLSSDLSQPLLWLSERGDSA
jgi:hypothetical protein